MVTERGHVAVLANDGTTKWMAALDAMIRQLVVTDLDGDGRSDLLIGGPRGRLIALGSDGSRLFEIDLREAISHVETADLDGDGAAEVVAATERGEISPSITTAGGGGSFACAAT